MTTTEVAELFRIDRKTVAKWCRDGTLDAVRIGEGGDWRIKRTCVDAILNGETKR
jgi:excisionase family DNA binding protein